MNFYGFDGGAMFLGTKSILGTISISLQLNKFLIDFIKAILLPNKDYFSIRRFAVKSFNCLLCLIIFQFSVNHVICIEFSHGKIARSHLQQYECCYSQGNSSIKHIQYPNPGGYHTLPANMIGTASSCPDCIDEHIQFLKLFSNVDFSPVFLPAAFFTAYQNHSFQNPILLSTSLFHKYKRVPSSANRLASIRSTVLLV
jgi:hypothetical protein